MSNHNRNAIFVGVLAAVLFAPTSLPAVEITFKVRMAHQIELGRFDPDNEFVDLAGTFNGWGTGDLIQLADPDGDQIYEVTLDGFTAGEYIEYKFRYNGAWDGREEFPGVGRNRTYTVPGGDSEILVWYNDHPPGEIGPLHWWNDTVFYEIFVRSFYDSDGDGIGDFQGLIQKLDYLNDGDPATDHDLGVTGIWLMPINDSPSYHGYDVIDYRALNPDYGTMADFQELLDAAHARGIKVIVDYVTNHCSSQHPWFVAASNNDPDYRDFFRWSPTDPGQIGPWGQQVWHWHNSGWYYGLFWGGMPDLNYETPVVKDIMFDNATWWLDTVGVDGFRLDAVLYAIEDGDQLQNTPATLQFWEDFNAHVKSVKPDVLAVGEAWTDTNTVLEYSTEDRFDFCFEFDLARDTVIAVNNGNTRQLSDKICQVYGLYRHNQFGTFLSNHDQNRSFDQFERIRSRAKVAAGIYMMLPGMPFVYYGEELGMTGVGAHENIRTPMQWNGSAHAGFTTGTPWHPVNDDYPQTNVMVEEQDPDSLLNWYKRLIQLRNETPALRRGLLDPLQSSKAPVLGFLRTYENQKLLCLANTAYNRRNNITLTGTSNSLPAGDVTLVNLLDPADTFDVTVTAANEITGLSLDGREVAVYELQNEDVLEIPLDSFTVTRGTHVGGGLPELAQSDNADLSIQRSSSDIQSRTEFEVSAVSPYSNPDSLAVELEGSVFARTTVNQSIEFFDFAAGQWETIDVRPASRFSDSTVVATAGGDLSRFVEADANTIRARILYSSIVARQQFSSNTDRVVWLIQ